MTGKVVVLCSGGLDSVTLAYYIKDMGAEPILVTVNYGQRMWFNECRAAGRCAALLECELHKVTLIMGSLLAGSALTDRTVEVPTGKYSEEGMTTTVVPNRNAILANIAAAAAVSKGAGSVALAVHSGDHPLYVDCRPPFLSALANQIRASTEAAVSVYTPFLRRTKRYIVGLGHELGVIFDETWSCYQGGELHCGLCSTCLERKEAFRLAEVPDPTRYRE